MQGNWTDSDGQLLRSLRERAGLDRASFARACTLSLAQLTELEQGGHGRFYNDRIKDHTGRTLLKKLGHVSPPPPPPPVEATPEDAAAAAPATEPAREAAVEEVQPSQARNPWPLRLGIAAAIVATLVVILMPRATRESPQVVEVPVAPASAPQPAASEAPAQAAAADAAASAPQPPASAAVVVAAPVASVAAPEARCDMPPRDQAVPYTPPNALRPNNYVYIESTRDVSVCVVDGQNRQTLAVVKPGEGASVYGTPPFMVQARQWAELRVFYQGIRVVLDTPTPPAAVLLNSR